MNLPTLDRTGPRRDSVGTLGKVDARTVQRVLVHTPASAVAPLIHHRPQTGLEGKFSLEYGIAAALLDRWPDLESFGNAGVQRGEARRLIEAVRLVPGESGDGLLAGEVRIEVALDGWPARTATLAMPPGSPERPPSDAELREKLRACVGASAAEIAAVEWHSAAGFLRRSSP